jgi:hypothetical protein
VIRKLKGKGLKEITGCPRLIMKNEDFDDARNKVKFILGSTQLAETIADWSHACTRNLLTKIEKDSDCLTREYIDTFLQFAGFFHYSINLKLFQELKQNRYEDTSDGIIKIFSNTIVRVFYKETRDSVPDAINAYANEVDSFIHNSISRYVELVMSNENENRDRFLISVSLLSYSISQKLGVQDYKQLIEDVLATVMKVMDTKKIDESIAMLTD